MAKLYKDVKIPSELYFNIKEFIERYSELGFRSVSEFVNSASRNEMERIEDRRKNNE
jgi:metal-responsive CopG/Arc/MetJ family transcriptional regulator